MYWAVQQLLSRTPEAHAWRIVEIGSGLGYLTNVLQRSGYTCIGLDISATAVDAATARFGAHYARQDVFDPDPEFVGAFDLAILLETIEHVPDPLSFLAAVTRLVRDGGSVFLTTPSRDVHPDGARWRTDLPPVHLYWMTEHSVEELARRVGRRAELTDFTEFNRAHEQTVALGDLEAVRGPLLDASFAPCREVPWRTRVMERLREVPALAKVARAVYDRGRPNRTRLRERSFSIAAVLRPESDGADPGS